MKNYRISRILSFAFVVALTLGQLTLPIRGMAMQVAAPAPTTQAAEPTKAATSTETKPGKSEQDELNVYRHAPIVQKLAKVLNLDVETTAKLCEYINVGIILLGIAFLLLRMIPKAIRTRKENLKNSLESARKMTADASTRLQAVEAKLANMDQEITQFRAEVERDSQSDEARIKATLSEESARIVAAAEQEISTAAAQARRGLQRYAADLAIEQAAKQLVLTPETDRALIAEFSGELTKGGKN